MIQEQMCFSETMPDWTMSKLGNEAWDWIHTTYGGKVTNEFIRLALYVKTRLNKQIGQRCIWEKMRWDYEFGELPDGEEFKLCDKYTKYVALFAEWKVPELKGYFSFRGQSNSSPSS